MVSPSPSDRSLPQVSAINPLVVILLFCPGLLFFTYFTWFQVKICNTNVYVDRALQFIIRYSLCWCVLSLHRCCRLKRIIGLLAISFLMVFNSVESCTTKCRLLSTSIEMPRSPRQIHTKYKEQQIWQLFLIFNNYLFLGCSVYLKSILQFVLHNTRY
jgi:hypothetical protein